MKLTVVVVTWATLVVLAECQEESEERLERITDELKFTDWDLNDYYEDIAKIRKKVLLNKEKYSDEIKLLTRYGSYLGEQSVNFRAIPEDDIPYELIRNYTLLVKPGDSLLNTTEYQKLVTFAKENEHLSRNVRIQYPDDPERKIGKQTFLDLLATSRNVSLLQEVWVNWQNGISNYLEHFGQVLSLVKEAASQNEMYDAKSYWEMLVEYEDGYQKAETLWSEIEPLYRKLHEFVLNRLNHRYKTNFTDIPVYLTGSNFGEDWSNLAELVIPHQQMYNDAKFAFEELSVKDLYELAEDCGEKMGFGKLAKNFWTGSNFENDICLPTVLLYTTNKYSEIITCQNVSWNTYIDAHRAVLEIDAKSVDFLSLPRRELRQSLFDEALASLGSIIAIQNLPNYGLTPECDYAEMENATEHGLSAKLLVALRVLPRLAYYMAADVWRLQELENPSENIGSSWWEMRKKYQGVEAVSNEETDFLGDSYMTSNKPYLAKFLGALLQFQILTYHQLEPFTHNDNLAERFGVENDYKNAINDISSKSSMELLTYNYGISEIEAQPLLEFFEPLKDYLDNAPIIPYSTTTRERKIDVPPEVSTETSTTTLRTTTAAATQEHEFPAVQNDQESNAVEARDAVKPKEAPSAPPSGHSAGMYVLITIGACFFILVAVVVFKKVVQMKRPRTNNRRFETP